MRLDKYLAEVGLGTRSEVKRLLKKKQITVDGKCIVDGKKQIEPTEVDVCYAGKSLRYQTYYYYMFNKPQGVLSATVDKAQKTIIELLTPSDQRPDLFPVGRLDKDTTGLMLVTNDGALAHELLAPKKHVAKTYRAKLAGIATEETIATFKAPLTLKNGEVTKPAQLKILSYDHDQAESLVEITITEGKYHQVKRMFAAVGLHVLELKRLKMGTLSLDEKLKAGQYRALTPRELASLKQK